MEHEAFDLYPCEAVVHQLYVCFLVLPTSSGAILCRHFAIKMAPHFPSVWNPFCLSVGHWTFCIAHTVMLRHRKAPDIERNFARVWQCWVKQL